MGFATHLGPWLLGTVKSTTGTTAGTIRNLGNTVVNQSYTAPTSVILATPAAQQLFVLPAGAKILRFNIEVIAALTGATNCGVVIGTSGTSNFYMTTLNTGTSIAQVSPATIAAATVASKTNNVGSTDAIIYGTFTAATADATAGSIVVSVDYVVRNYDGAAYPTYSQN
jgi:hypothetical protein